MLVVFLSPAYPPEMVSFTHGLAAAGARVIGVGEGAAPDSVRGAIAGWIAVDRILDRDHVVERVAEALGGVRPDRVEALWEVVVDAAAALRARLGVAGMSPDVVVGFRDKPTMRARVDAAGLRAPRTRRASTVAEVWAAARELGPPLVIKPVAGAGSADTYVIRSEADLDRVLAALQHVPEVQVEEFVQGEEFTYETICVDGAPMYESVCRYEPSALDARKNEWISPIIQSVRDLDDPYVAPGVTLGRAVIRALGMGTGFTHMEWFRTPSGDAVFGEIACRSPGANMVDLMNYTGDVDLYRAWADAVVHGRVGPIGDRPYSAAIVFKRARGRGRIRAIHGLEAFLRAHGGSVARVDLLPIGAPRRDWTQTFLSDGNLVVRDPDPTRTIALARAVATTVHLDAG
jgi:biotin carboxylase